MYYHYTIGQSKESKSAPEGDRKYKNVTRQSANPFLIYHQQIRRTNFSFIYLAKNLFILHIDHNSLFSACILALSRIMNYSKINNIIGWLSFIIASIVYILTLEPSASFWDCGEFISAAYKLQIVHQPGAPLFLMVQKMFSLLAGGNIHQIAYWMNIGSALSSGATILFLFWTITMLVKKVVWKANEALSISKLIIIMGSGFVGAMAYTFSDSFWFSAVESEVYAMSSLCTAIVFWAILKWDAHADKPNADKWLIFIAYIMGLSIGVHLLNLLAIPAIALLYYFRKTNQVTRRGTFMALLAGICILAFIQYGIVQYLIKFAAYSDLFFVNTLKLGFGSGIIFFVTLLIVSLTSGVLYTLQKTRITLIIAVVAFLLLMAVGGGLSGLVVGLALLAFLEYLIKIREKMRILNMALVSIVFIIFGYCSFAMIVIRAKANPSLNNSDPDNAFSLLGYVNREQYGDRPLLYGQYFDAKPIDSKEGDYIYRKGKDKYEIAGRKYERIYDRYTLFPRMYSDDPNHVEYYRDWMKLGQTQSPTFVDNLGFFFSYQLGFSYARYFAWNFIGRQDDEKGDGNNTDGNWISGIKFIDRLHLGPQDQLPKSITENKAYNRFYFLPFIIGLIGLIWHYKRNRQDASIVGLLFFFTGIAIVIYLNPTPLQPRERDYAYSGSFYAFAIWIGLGVAGLAEFFHKKTNATNSAILATLIALFAAPVVLAKDEWNDHDRSTKFTTRDIATDYLESCAPNAILFTYGDNDTYPLWYAQEVENIRPDVRVVNLSLLGTDWYIRQLKEKTNNSAPLPITMPNEKFVQGVRDVMGYQDYHIEGSTELRNVFDILVSDHAEDKVSYQDGSEENFLPTKNLKITINPDEIIATKTLPEKQKSQITPALEWKYNKNYVSKSELAMFDILAHNNWKRPIYFAITVPSDNYIGLDKYLYNEGFAYRLLPLKNDIPDSVWRRSDLTNTPLMYHNMMNKFKWGNIKNARYLDPESMRMVLTIINNFNILAENLYKEGRLDEARKALRKCLEVTPDKIYSLNFSIRRYAMADLLYKLQEFQQANKIVEHTADFVEDQLNFLYSVSKDSPAVNARDIQMGLSILNELVKLTADNNQTSLSNKLKTEFNSIKNKFMSLN